MPTNIWSALPTTYINGTTPSELWLEIEYYANSTTTYKIKRYSYQETQKSLINNTWTPIKISGSSYPLNAPNTICMLRIYLAKGEADKYLHIDSMPEISNMHFNADLII